MTLDLARLKALCDAATPGPWAYDSSGVWHVASGGPITRPLDPRDPPDGIARVGDPYPRGDNNPTENVAFIAACREAVPALLAALEAAEETTTTERALRIEKQEERNRYYTRLTALEAAGQRVVRGAHDIRAWIPEWYIERVDAFAALVDGKETTT